MRATKAADLVPAGAVAAVVGYVGCRLVYGDLPPLPTLAGLPLAVLAVVEALLGYSLRNRIRGKGGGRPVQALTAARSVALAKASSLLGAIMVGVWLGVLGYVVPAASRLAAAKSDIPAAAVGAVCSALLIGAALWLEHCCRTPDDPREDDARSTG
ncbi:DUF3180 domain-containing protein [Actinokineospora bangkokensis]|uniref:DUF3180 domain-containing protein n=1 Tax=Actinokineospora bangkokensis TaxID=1193682 RepID=A0A1Q9LE38_9PSEU|nr:DUF3180 domain-containing protein [Actinokineospora bangkokensis]OLR90259.1 hypothetical protein BJP25_01620 [Actinokineospora bangkokensis]